jgi:hypothetical protein
LFYTYFTFNSFDVIGSLGLILCILFAQHRLIFSEAFLSLSPPPNQHALRTEF